ncbi:MAG: hypothetical protein E7258_08005 [Lachnospiraceae bacterium]|nr:hypothetical protein [Lachnospiraceae bacterium]
MYTKKSSFPAINYTVTLGMLAWMIYRGYMILNGTYGVLRYLLFMLSIDTFFGIQVLLLALSIGKTDQNKDVDYGGVIPFNKIMLGVYVLYVIVLHVIIVMRIISLFR